MTYEEFISGILDLTGIDLALYKENQMRRRICARIDRLKFDGFESYLSRLRKDRYDLAEFLDYITINVTEFFRTKDQWDFMADQVLTDLGDKAVIWSAACATGEEPYSLAISIAERRPLSGIRIIATDINDTVLDKARKGVYTAKVICGLDSNIRERYFSQTETGLKVSDEIRSHVEFRHLNLLSDPFPQGCDLIALRNVLIYFTAEAQDFLYPRFHDSLVPGGYLFTGNAEQLITPSDFGFEKVSRFLYRKK